MAKKGKTSDAVSILHGRYVKDDPERKASLAAERLNADVAQMIYDLRKQAGLTQQELAKLVGTTQSVISRLEDADYEGHSLSMVSRIAKAVNQRLVVLTTDIEPEFDAVRHAFQVTMRNLRRQRGLTIDELARKVDIEPSEVGAMEHTPGYRATPLTLHKLSQFYAIPDRRLAMLAGAIRDVPEDLQEEASYFAAQSDSFAGLTPDERKALDQFVGFLRDEG